MAHYITFFSKQHSPTVSARLSKLQWSYPKLTMIEISNSTEIPISISGSANIHVMDKQFIPWALNDLFGSRTPDSLETMQNYFRRFRALHGKSLNGIAYDALQSSWCAFIRRWNRMLEDGRSFPQWLAN